MIAVEVDPLVLMDFRERPPGFTYFDTVFYSVVSAPLCRTDGWVH